MVLKGKVVSELVIRSPAVKFFSVFAKQLHNLQDIVDKVHDGKLHEGDWHDIGSVMSWGLTTGGAVTIWTIQYKKLNEDVAPPYHYLDIITATTKETDAHLRKA
ncbi:hypothetical protein D0Y65_004435 [Glycine soja]|uniref:MLP-like protein 43 n=1 Tax=Glycine soja TaxID=3848 RepID=A0A0B2QTV4_GLYSO|nr:MLP-like protein 43 [Glycine soja]RZC25724.1 hypothetical protein D0Y65_004435 [Glycine soja]